MKNNSSENVYGWFDVSNNLHNQRNWRRKYIELDRTKRRLIFHCNECIRSSNEERKEGDIYDLNSKIISLSSSSSSLNSSNNIYKSINGVRSNYMFQSLSEYISPSLSKTILSSSLITDDKRDTLTPVNNHSTESNNIFIDSLSDRPSSITTTTTTTIATATRQSKTKFSHFFGRSSTNNKSNHLEHFFPSSNINIDSLKRTKSVTKLERQKRDQQNLIVNNSQQSLPKIPSNRSRSYESLFLSHGAGNGPLGSILSSKPVKIILDNCDVRRVHPSIIQSSHLNNDHLSYQYIQIENKNENKNCYLRSKQYLTDNTLLLNHLRHTCLQKTMDGLRIDNSLDICILEAKGLPPKKKYYVKIFVDDDIYGKTTSKERGDILFWGENFIFKDLPQGCSTLHCKIYREIERRKQKENNGEDIDLIGYVNIPLLTITENQFVEEWYSLQIPFSKEKSQKSSDGLFNIRIKAKYQPVQILPIQSYLHFQQYIRRNYLRLVQILEPYITLRDKDQIATSLTRIAQSLSFSTPFLVDIVQAEILSTPDNTLTFRGNSIATKSMESYMKLIGETYLRETLRRFVTDIVSSKNVNDIDLEVDPDRVTNIQNLERNQIRLRLLCQKIWSEIEQSHTSFPNELKVIFCKLRQLSSSDETMFNLISGSVFLRFLCPAILSPNLFGLTQEYPNEKASRKLTLVAKTLQTLANFSKFGSKECYMKFMNDFVSKESDNMRRFLANISRIDNDYIEQELIDEDIKCDIDLGREYSILHTTLTHLFEQIHSNIRQSLNELEYILNQLSNIKLFYFSSKSVNTEIDLHHHHSTPSSNDYLNNNPISRYNSQISLSLTNTQTQNRSSEGYHSISTSSTITNIQNVNNDNFGIPLSFTNPLYNEKEEDIDSDLSDDNNKIDSSKAHYFINNLSIEPVEHCSLHQTIVDSSSDQSLEQEPLFLLNNCYMKKSVQSLSSSNTDTLLRRSNWRNDSFKIDNEVNNISKEQSLLSSQQLTPKMGVKALNHTPTNKNLIDCEHSPILSLYQQEKSRRIECEKQTSRLRAELNRSNEQLEEYRQLINLISEKSLRRTNIDDDLNYSDYFDDHSKPIEKSDCLNENNENKLIFLYNKVVLR